MVWHYQRKRFSLIILITIGLSVTAALTIFTNMRSQVSVLSSEGIGAALLFRTPGLATVERVVYRMDRGEPNRGIKSGIVEAMTILIPRAIWPRKPQTVGLEFADIFFYDYFIGRGDPIDGIKSGVSSTIIGETIWISGIAYVTFSLLVLGIFTKTANIWYVKSCRTKQKLFVYALLTSQLPVFVEAPQNALNTYMMIGSMCVVMLGASLTCKHKQNNNAY